MNTQRGNKTIQVDLVYRGKIVDKLGSLEDHKTRIYPNYIGAHMAAEKLAKKYYESRAEIIVEARMGYTQDAWEAV